jgi:hypothetical protein
LKYGPARVLKADDMDYIGMLFGVVLESREGDINPLVHLYVEDDENYHYKMSFDAFWCNDMYNLMNKILKENQEIE